MVDTMTLNYLFFLGILIPTIITVTLFIVFLVCWYKYRIRQQIMNKRHDPHGRFKNDDEKYMLGKPRIPPSTISSGSSTLNNNNNVKKSRTDNYEESPEPTEGFDNPTIYRTAPDSGFSDFNEIHCKMEPGCEKDRPNSQASTDSEDSGFRSSRSGQYIHSASNSNSNEHTNHGHICAGSTPEGFPLFKPIKLHPSEAGHSHALSVHRNSSKHSRHKHRKPLPLPTTPSHSYSTDVIQLSQNNPQICRPKVHMPQTVEEIPMQLRITTAMIHRPAFMEESSLYSVV